MKSNRKNPTLFLATMVVAVCGLWVIAPPAATAEIIEFTVSFKGSGTLDGVAFPLSAFTITSFADTANKVYAGYGVYSMDHLSSSISIAGLGHLDILTGTRTFWDPGARRVGYSRAGINGYDLMLGPEHADLGSWDMISPIGPLTGVAYGLHQWGMSPLIDTSGGVLKFDDGGSSVAVFSAARVPEPYTLSLLAVGGIEALRRRRRARL
ncbi:MAG: PEP-CTERM sorting domain-containing protein [Planctomycetes bacterium]|nr:PEP-CTERM sorting domain-containing protein [Planctomycetota bacterium]